MITAILAFLVLMLISGLLYHIGGCGADGAKMYPRAPKWLWGKINGKLRDWGCAIASLAAVPIVYPLQWSTNLLWIFPAAFLLSWGALSTYWKKGANAKTIHWLAHGLGIGLAMIPFIWAGVPWWLLGIRAAILSGTMAWLSDKTKIVQIEEGGRGALIVLTEAILCLGRILLRA